MEDFYPAMNVTIFGDTAMKEEMLLTRGLSGGLSFNMTGVLRRREAWTHEQIPEENMHRAKAMGTQLEGGICKPRSPNVPTPVACTFSVQNCRKTVCCLRPPRLCYLLWQPPENQCLFFSLQKHFTHRYLAAPEIWQCISLDLPGEVASWRKARLRPSLGRFPVSEGFIAISSAWT